MAPKDADDVDARAYMREEAQNDRRNSGRGGGSGVVSELVNEAKGNRSVSDWLRQVPLGGAHGGPARPMDTFSETRAPNKEELALIRKTIAFIEGVRGYEEVARKIRNRLDRGLIRVRLNGLEDDAYAQTSPILGTIVIGRFDYSGGFDATLVHEEHHAENFSDLFAEDDPDKVRSGEDPGPAWNAQYAYEDVRNSVFSKESGQVFNEIKREGVRLTIPPKDPGPAAGGSAGGSQREKK